MYIVSTVYGTPDDRMWNENENKERVTIERETELNEKPMWTVALLQWDGVGCVVCYSNCTFTAINATSASCRRYEMWTWLHFDQGDLPVSFSLFFIPRTNRDLHLLGRWIVVEHRIARQLPMGCLQFNQLQQCATNGRCRCARIQEGISYRRQETFQLLWQMRFQISSNARQYEE